MYKMSDYYVYIISSIIVLFFSYRLHRKTVYLKKLEKDTLLLNSTAKKKLQEALEVFAEKEDEANKKYSSIIASAEKEANTIKEFSKALLEEAFEKKLVPVRYKLVEYYYTGGGDTRIHYTDSFSEGICSKTFSGKQTKELVDAFVQSKETYHQNKLKGLIKCS